MTEAIADVLEGWHASDEGKKTIALFSELRKLTLTVVIRALFGTELAQQLPACRTRAGKLSKRLH